MVTRTDDFKFAKVMDYDQNEKYGIIKITFLVAIFNYSAFKNKYLKKFVGRVNIVYISVKVLIYYGMDDFHEYFFIFFHNCRP